MDMTYIWECVKTALAIFTPVAMVVWLLYIYERDKREHRQRIAEINEWAMQKDKK